MRGKTNSVTTSGGGTSENTLKKLLDATTRASYLFYLYSGSSVDDLISYNDTENVTNMNNMFENCNNLITIPLLNTSKVTSTGSMFSACRKLTSIPTLDTSNVTNMSSMFSTCTSLTTIPLLYTSKVTQTPYMFSGCSKLTSIPALDVSNVTFMGSMFDNCSSLTAIHMTGMKVSFNISASTNFTTDALHEIITNLASVSKSQTLTMGSTNLAKVSEEYKTIATNKGWTLA